MIDVKINNVLTLNKKQLKNNGAGYLIQFIKERLTFDNPKYVIAKKRGYSTWNLAQTLAYYFENDEEIVMPKGFLYELISLNDTLAWNIINNTYTSPKTIYAFTKDLYPYQKKAVDSLLQWDVGTLQAGCGSGKTICGLYLLAQRKQNTIILVHTKDIMDQWIQQISDCLAVQKESIGIIMAGKMKIKPITIGMIQTVHKRTLPIDYFGMVIQDETHHVAATTFINSILKLNCKYQLGLSATPYRKDGLSRLIEYYIGKIRHEIPDEEVKKYRKKITPKIIVRKTDFYTTYTDDFTLMINDMICNERRNKFIANDIVIEAQLGNTCLVLSNRVEHCKILKDLLRAAKIRCLHIHGKTLRRQELLQKVKEENASVLLATGNLAGEGLDIPAMNRLFLVTPNNPSGGKLKQYIGRITRIHPGKKDALVYDYVDLHVGTCWGMWLSRKKMYDSELV